MGVLIEGMEMPLPGTFNIIYIYSDGQVHMPSWGKGMTQTNGVKAIPVPPHGRLIDADALCKTLHSLAENEYTPEVFANWIENHIDTVIPATEEG